MQRDIISLTTELVSAYVANNALSARDLPTLIGTVHEALIALLGESDPVVTQEPAVPIKKSVQPEYIVCLEDGRKLKSLKRHLRSAYDMSPGEYRAKWGLPGDYPMVAPVYAAFRSEIAKNLGLGLSTTKRKNSG